MISTLLARPVEAGTLWQVRDEVFASQWMRDTPEASRGLALLRESAAARESVERLTVDFERLFTGSERRIDPVESAYVPDVSAADLELVYGEVGYRPIPDLPADHIANELGYFSQLTVLTSTPQHHLAHFAREHLRPWAAECLAEISLTAASLFYQGVGAVGMDFVESLPTR